MPDLYSFTFDKDNYLPILTRGEANTIDPFSYTGDGRIYSKINNQSTDPIDVVGISHGLKVLSHLAKMYLQYILKKKDF